jgi:predicted site-specific integrase-resolvase
MPRRPWRTPRLPELVGAKEACELLGIQKMTLNRWLKPGSGTLGPDGTYMIPPKRIEAGPVWVREDVVRFAEEIGRQRAPAGQAKASE